MKAVKKISPSIKKVFEAKKVGVLFMGFEVDHTHVNVFPLHSEKDIELNRYMQRQNTVLEKQDMEETQKQILDSLSE